MNLMSVRGISLVPETQLDVLDVERAKVVEAAKLLNIQKEVGFTFEEIEGETIKQLIDQEGCDRVKKLDWEQRNGDQ
ncbi:hypothetical protein A2U01_0008198 [Trifolium medium]|uniref:Uncharacterized protein n=1 Tax=Trifolium medium TaxID=97028 RepID=A0A392MIJ5_9FABA|nr:hypothetical protein [Trifolium medium]